MGHMLFALLSFVAIIASIAVHELAHLIAARIAGIRAVAYFIGFGPKLFSFVRGGVEYGLRIIPLGGYVKIPRMDLASDTEAAEEDSSAADSSATDSSAAASPTQDGGLGLLEPTTPAEATGSPGVPYVAASLPRQLAVAVAGPLSHAFLAFLLVLGAFAFTNPDRFDGAAGVAYVIPGSAGEEAGFRTADVVLEVNSQPVASWDEVVDVVASSTADGELEEASVSALVSRDGEKLLLAKVSVEAWSSLGIPFTNPADGLPLPSKVGAAVSEVGYLTTATVSALGDVFGDLSSATRAALGHQPPSANRPASILGVVDTSADFGAGYGTYGVLMLLAQLNIILGIFNLIPLHPLDGGHAAAAVANRIFSATRMRRPALLTLQYLTYPVLGAMLLLFLVGFSIDLRILNQDPVVWIASLTGLGIGWFLWSRLRSQGTDPSA